jgi:hypothetical protein
MKKFKYDNDQLIEKFKDRYGLFAIPEDPLYVAGYEVEELEDGKIRFCQITATIKDIKILFTDKRISIARWQYGLYTDEAQLIGNEKYIKLSDLADIKKSMDCLFRETSNLIEGYIYEEKITPEIFVQKTHTLYREHISRFLLNN